MPAQQPSTAEDKAQFMGFSNDHVVRVRAAKAAAQREMESFGDVSEYDVTILHGQLTKEPVVSTQPSLDFKDGAPEGAD